MGGGTPFPPNHKKYSNKFVLRFPSPLDPGTSNQTCVWHFLLMSVFFFYLGYEKVEKCVQYIGVDSMLSFEF